MKGFRLRRRGSVYHIYATLSQAYCGQRAEEEVEEAELTELRLGQLCFICLAHPDVRAAARKAGVFQRK